ncbi:conserved membrane protein of unknown function [Tenacibaculum sp. 190524A02b]|uniref:ABC transporter permease n=1 Tax=Tenacibaculum vairaonense TaxID=3137860 RepID=A0ABP1F913_9FLAO
MEKVSNKPITTKSWLQRLKDESWEAELLVSAIAIFGTFQLFHIIDWWANSLIDVLNPSQYKIGYFIVFFGLIAISILASMFIIHFFLRAYWIGLVGLNSVFPDYSIEDSAYSKIYTEKILTILPKLKDSIEKVDELCSVIFSVAFTFLLMYSYVAISSSLYLLIYNLLSQYIPSQILLIPAYLALGLLIVQLFFSIIANLKQNKNNRKLQIINFRIVRIVSIISYGPLYKSILQVSMIFGSNFKKKKSIVYLIFLFLAAGIVLSSYKIKNTNILYLINKDIYFDNTKTYATYYKSNNKNNTFLLTPEIESDIIDKNIIKVFIPIFNHERKQREEICSPFNEDSKIDQKEAYLKCYHAYNFVYLNDEKVSVDFLKYYHPRTNQFGIIGYVPLTKTKTGRNILEIRKYFGESTTTKWSIPFYTN